MSLKTRLAKLEALTGDGGEEPLAMKILSLLRSEDDPPAGLQRVNEWLSIEYYEEPAEGGKP